MGIMKMLKLSTLLLACTLIIGQMYSSQAAPSIASTEFLSDGFTLSDDDTQRLLRAVKALMQITAVEQEPRSGGGNSWGRPVSKRCTGLSTCVLGKLSQDIHKLQTFPRTDVGADTPGKK
ncbi:calcitonin/calcitonin-related polypeptide, alpha [Genypterus blacodes]|uniref:calcitonin/calcitonin-related polypeptide, alpha n=1 Tax=Genypterus blacodes TaxID=154954 RepID=UPI003F75CA1C